MLAGLQDGFRQETGEFTHKYIAWRRKLSETQMVIIEKINRTQFSDDHLRYLGKH